MGDVSPDAAQAGADFWCPDGSWPESPRRRHGAERHTLRALCTRSCEALGCLTVDEGNIHVSQAEQTPPLARVTCKRSLPSSKWRVFVKRPSTRSARAGGNDEFGLFLGGDHSISIGTIAAVSQRGKVGVVWVDAHTDMNTPNTSPSGNIHGMSLASLLGDGPKQLVDIGCPGAKLSPQQVVVIAAHDIDNDEKVRVKQSGIQVYTMRDIDQQGIDALSQQILGRFKSMNSIHVSLDIDACDPSYAVGVGTPVAGGLRYREAHLLMELLADSGKVRSMDAVECNPILDSRNQTAETAVELILSLLGKQIL